MAFEVKFYSFAKKLNSTKRPTGTPRTYQCEIKADCDIINPIIILGNSNVEPESNYNYCYIPIWNRYYFVTNYTYKNGLWYIHLSVDSLATWKPYIGSSTQYIERAQTGGNGNIVDSLTIGRAASNVNNAATYRLFTANNTTFLGGSYVVSIKGSEPSSLDPAGACTYYALSPTAMRSLITNLTDSTSTAYTDIAQEILKANLDPFQYLVECKWYPLTLYDGPIQIQNIKLGWFNIPITGQAVVAGYTNSIRVADINIPKHPQYSNSLNKYLNNSKFHSIYMYLPGVGLQKIPSDPLVGKDTLTVSLLIDTYTGDGQYSVTVDNVSLLTIPATIGVDYPLIATYAANKTHGGTLEEVLTETARQLLFPVSRTRIYSNYATGGGDKFSQWATKDTNTLAAINLTANPTTLTVNYSGNMGSRCFITQRPFIELYSIDIPVIFPDYTAVGYPVYSRGRISKYSGYIKIIDSHCEAPATDRELNEINDYMNGGFFYE